jgi:CheY-like chemotaxis protein
MLETFSEGRILKNTVIVIDDDQFFSESVCGVLRGAGYVTLHAGDGIAAQKLMDRIGGKFDLAVIDLSLPGVSGFELIGLLNQRAPSVKIIATTAVFRPPYLDVALEMGAHRATRKPENPAVWPQLVGELLGNSGA